jgi:CBS domain containing-hemolysin-like protein
MKQNHPLNPVKSSLSAPVVAAYWLMISANPVRASMFEGETLDTIADVISWVALIIAPIVGIAVFWLVHILPEKIAEKKKHPQAGAIQCLCLLSLAFGGLLWPLAWLWAYTKPALYKMAYGTDQVEHGHEEAKAHREKGGKV